MILEACHHKHGACLCLFRHYGFFSTIGADLSRWLHIVSIHLSSKESLSEDLEERFLWGKIDIVLPFRSIEAEPAALASSKDNYTNLATPDKLITRGLVDRFFVARQVCRINDALRLNRIENRFTAIFLVGVVLRISHKIVVELVNERDIELRTFVEKVFAFKGT